MKTLITGCLAFMCCVTMQAQAVYVDSNTGDDNNTGTEESPFYSIQKAVEIISSDGNDIFIRIPVIFRLPE